MRKPKLANYHNGSKNNSDYVKELKDIALPNKFTTQRPTSIRKMQSKKKTEASLAQDNTMHSFKQM